MIARSSSTVAKKSTKSGNSKVLPYSEIPGPKGTIQNVLEYAFTKGALLDVVKKRFERFGPIYSEQVLDTQLVNISDADAAEKVLRTEKKFQMRPGFETLNEIVVEAKVLCCSRTTMTNGIQKDRCYRQRCYVQRTSMKNFLC
jgi:hypothetical protein